MTSAQEGALVFADGGELAYRICGQEHGGTPLLLLRPLGGTMALWHEFLAPLSEQFCVISFDYRGIGQSRNEPHWITTRGLARDAMALVQHLRCERVHVFGISLGGMVATWLAILAGERVAKLCLASTPALGIALSYNGVRRELALATQLFRPRSQVGIAMVRNMLSPEFRKAHPDRLAAIEEVVRAQPIASRRLLAKHALAGALHDARKDLAGLRTPTLVLAGGNDRLMGVGPARDLARRLPRATFQVIEGGGHALTLEQPIETAKLVRTWLAAQD